jgi:hypothetical protein
LSTDSSRKVTQAQATLGIVAALYDDSTWPILEQALDEALGGDGSTLLLLSDFYTDRNSRGHYTSNQNEVIYAVNCLDRPEDSDIAELRRQQVAFAKVSPRFGAYLAWGSLPCKYWAAPANDSPHAITAPGADPILVVGTLRDPATPYQWAVGLANQLQSGVLLSWNGDGHTAYGRGSTCIDKAVDRYLIQGKPPADGTRCN